MKKIFFILLICSASFSLHAQKEYVNHVVKKGETVYSISKKYGISKTVIYQFNPDVKRGVQTNTVLIIPISEGKKVASLKKYRVKRRETIKSIAKKFGITEDDLKKYNKDLYARPVKKGEKISIPIFAKDTTSNTIIETVKTINDTITTYTVLVKETKYGIARKYGITIAQLKKLNPQINEGLQVGEIINVPKKIIATDSTIIETDDFEYYEVLPKEGFYRLKVKLNLSENEIIALNPFAKNGLKNGMILKIPKRNSSLVAKESFKVIDLEDYVVVNTQKKNLAIMLPFKLNRIDSLNQSKDLLKSDPTLRAAIDFYSGVLMATEFAKDKGISTHLNIYDTEASTDKINSIIITNDFSNTDAVIGPLLSKNIALVASKLQNKNIPVFSPLSKRKIKQYSNLYQSIPSDKLMAKTMLDYIVKRSDSINVIVITGTEWTKTKGIIAQALPQAKYITPKKGNYFNVAEIETKLDDTLDNWVILDNDNPILVSNVIGLLNGLKKTMILGNGSSKNKKIRLFAVYKNDAFSYSEISNMHLANLNFTFPSVNKHYDYEVLEPFLVSYKNKHGVLPNRFAIRGFDVTYDVLLRLASSKTLSESVKDGVQTEYIENKFKYTNDPVSGYINNAFYIMKYNNELKLEVVE